MMFPTGMTFHDIAQQLGRDEVWVAAAFYGQVGTTPLKPMFLWLIETTMMQF
jgi:hypothetical protein